MPDLQAEATRVAQSVMSDSNGNLSPPVTSKPLPPLQSSPQKNEPTSTQLNKPLPPVQPSGWRNGSNSSRTINDVYKMDQRATLKEGDTELSGEDWLSDLSPKSMPLRPGGLD